MVFEGSQLKNSMKEFGALQGEVSGNQLSFF